MAYKSKEKIKNICIINVAGKNGAICELQKLFDSLIYEYESPSKKININDEFKNLQFIFREISEIDNNEEAKGYSVLKDSELLELCQNQEIYDNTETRIKVHYKRNIKIKKCDQNNYDKKKENFKIIINVDYLPNMQSDEFSGKFNDLCDPLFMQYLLLLVQKLNKNELNYLVVVRDKSLEKGERKDHYFQVRQSLRVYHEKFSNVIDCFFYDDGDGIKHIYRTNNDNDGKGIELNEKDGKKKEEHFGRIFPFIPLTKDIYGDLVQIKDNGGKSIKILKDVYNEFLQDIKRESGADIDTVFLTDKNKSDNMLTQLIFIYTLYYICKSEKDSIGKHPTMDEKQKFNNEIVKILKNKLQIIHEVCVDYAEGIHQLIENAIVHSIHKSSKRSQDGCGVLTLRIRKKEDSKYLSDDVKNEDVFKNTKFFMELYVTDLSYVVDDYKGIVEKFKENVKRRDVNGEYKDKFKDLELVQLFGAKQSDDLEEYFKNAKNIAFHFGLQILANTVELSKGYMFVRSGNEDENKSLCIYENNNKISIKDEENKDEEKKNIYKISNNFEWHDGTAYIIYLPIALREEISNVDIPAVEINNDTDMGQDDEKIVYLFKSLSISDVREEIREIMNKDIPKKEKLVGILSKILSINKCKEDKIPVIDCSQLHKIIKDSIENAGKEDSGSEVDKKITDMLTQLSQYNLYEILAKAIFRFIAEEKEQKRTIAVINVEDRYKVIHLLRQFMLFYRRGESELIKGKSIFIVDKDAELDVLLFDLIDRIAENMYLSQLTGGLDGKAMEIIRYFADSRTNRGKSDVRHE